ncbi:MAG: beta-lactamase family protein [Bacteroidales bacterium]|nr:beta-lactamase family protein [Bacteroidales bacterium]
MKTISKILLASLALILVSCHEDDHRSNESRKPLQEFVVAEPESVGYSSERLDRIDQLVESYIEENKIPGAVGFIARKGKVVYHKSFGMRDPEQGDPMEKDDIFRIASMSKAITSVAVMMLYEEGHFLLDDKLSQYIPEFKEMTVLESVRPDGSLLTRPAEKEITIRHLLTHTSGICYPFIHGKLRPLCEELGIPDGFVITDKKLSETMPALAKVPLLHEPGEKFTYGLNTDLLGYFVEVISGMTFEEFLNERLFGPLGMDDACFYVPDEKLDRLVPVYASIDDGYEPSDVDAYNYPFKGGKSNFSGGAGICCTIEDYAKFMQMMVNGGTFNGQQILGRKTVDLMITNQIAHLPDASPFGLGFGLVTEKNLHQTLSSLGNYSWGGYFSTSYWMDPKEDLVGLFFVQMFPNWHGDIHPKFQVLTYQALVN